MVSINIEKYNALINLLDDPDHFVLDHVSHELTSMGKSVISLLEKSWEETEISITRVRIEDIIQQIQSKELTEDITSWANNGGKSLLDGAIQVVKYQYPEYDEQLIIDVLDQIKRDVWLEIKDKQYTPAEQVTIINRTLFDIHGFSGNKKDYQAPQNSYLNRVIETKKGNPLSLGVIYLYVAQGLGIPIYGVNLPSHFVLCYVNPISINKDELDVEDILFYINPFSRGMLYNTVEISRFLKQLNLPEDKKFNAPCSNIDMVRRMLNNLVFSYEKLGKKEKVKELRKIMSVL